MLDEIDDAGTVLIGCRAFAAERAGPAASRQASARPGAGRSRSSVTLRDELDRQMLYLRGAYSSCSVFRAGVDVPSLSARGVAGIGDAVAVHRLNLVVVAGGDLNDQTVAAPGIRDQVVVGHLVALYRRA